MRRGCVAGLVAFLTCATAPEVSACRFVLPPTTFSMEAADSKLVLYGIAANPRPGPGHAVTDFRILSVLKSDPVLRGRTVLQLPREIRVDEPNAPPRLVIFCDVFKGRLDPYRGVEATPALVKYLKGLIALDARDRTRLLRYCFDYLEHPDKKVADDAFREFLKSTDKDVGRAARALPPEKLRRWLRDKKTPPDRFGLYGFLLGNCGGRADAALLRRVADRFIGKEGPALIDGILTGYVLLAPRDGLAYVRSLIADPARPFQVRYSALRAIHYFHTTSPDVLTRKDRLDAVGLLLDHKDAADLPVEYLRGWRCWDHTDRILPLYYRPSHQEPFIRRAILRYALECPGEAPARFVAAVRRADAELVKDMEESLALEAESRRAR